ncbi:hypothetical protein DAEQUDRAFT_560585 [Daedalea quercina L-15889]|uniref:Uncharacterized protein n=1 Tax=Daedalea quercina L-15889 TaxID=1314783 RepID=A0A165M188_9APHY|nr:hypothetical protein DAEQUDRAFT_560585 [Daedalea quercina L-15889]
MMSSSLPWTYQTHASAVRSLASSPHSSPPTFASGTRAIDPAFHLQKSPVLALTCHLPRPVILDAQHGHLAKFSPGMVAVRLTILSSQCMLMSLVVRPRTAPSTLKVRAAVSTTQEMGYYKSFKLSTSHTSVLHVPSIHCCRPQATIHSWIH